MEGENLDNISAVDGKYTFVLNININIIIIIIIIYYYKNFHRLYETRAEESRESRESIIVVKWNDGQFIKHRKLWFGPKGWIAWLANAGCTHTIFCLSLLHNWIKRKKKEKNPGWRVQDQLNTSEPTAPYIIG